MVSFFTINGIADDVINIFQSWVYLDIFCVSTAYSQNGSSVSPNFETLIGNFEVENET